MDMVGEIKRCGWGRYIDSDNSTEK